VVLRAEKRAVETGVLMAVKMVDKMVALKVGWMVE
jgi:hypothetical protein